MRVRNVIEIGALLQQRRKDLNLTQAEVAERAGVSRDWIVSIENSRRSSIEVDRLLRTLDALGLEIEISPQPESAPTDADRAVLATLSRARAPGRFGRFGADSLQAAALARLRETFAERFDSGPLARQLQESALVRLGSDDRRVLETALQPGLVNLRDALSATESNERLRRVLGELSGAESLSEDLRHALQSVLRSAESPADEA